MAMFKWGDSYINPEDVSCIFNKNNGSIEYPFCMSVRLRYGGEYSLSYKRKADRDADAARLANLVSRRSPDPISRYEVEGLLDKVKNAIRRDIKALRLEIVKE